MEKIRRQWNRENYLRLLQYFILALALNTVIELLARRSVADTLTFAFGSPLAFFFGTLILFLTLSVSLLCRKRRFWLLFLCTVWLALAITDFVMLTFRSMPLTASDIWIMSSVRDIFEKYLSHIQLALIMLGISLVLGGVFFLWIRAKKYPAVFAFGACHTALLGLLVLALFFPLLHWGVLDRSTAFQNLPIAYHKNGFAYSFSASLVTGGVAEPENYSPDQVNSVLVEEEELPQTSEHTPNVIFVQLESFYDPANLAQIETAEDPVPNFTRLRKTYPSGLLSVPAIGAGTANTEFEILTGMNLSHFGVGEYPYMTIVNAQKTESMASVLSGLEYQTHAIHNNNATFYDRHIVYDNLGFDTFTSIEFMENVEYNARGWAKDGVLTEEIVKALKSTEERDFVLAVSVQPHGKYPKEPVEGAPTIAVTGEEDVGRKNGLEYYLGQLRECDAFVGELVGALAAYPEPTVVVFYGDHLPSFNFSQEELAVGTNQTTEYIIWANFPLKKVDRNLETYQLGAYVMNFCNIHEGSVFRLHQSYHYDGGENQDYQEALQILEYDLIYGEQYAGELEQEGEGLRFDVEDVLLTGITPGGEPGSYHVYGAHFTPYSRVYVDGAVCTTVFVSPQELLITQAGVTGGSQLMVAQVSGSDELDVLSWSTEITVPEV